MSDVAPVTRQTDEFDVPLAQLPQAGGLQLTHRRHIEGVSAEIRFASERFVLEGDRLVAVDGRLWLHGAERPLRLTVERFVCKDVAAGLLRQHVCGGVLHASLKRSDFGMTRFLPDVGDEVRLDIGVEASPR